MNDDQLWEFRNLLGVFAQGIMWNTGQFWRREIEYDALSRKNSHDTDHYFLKLMDLMVDAGLIERDRVRLVDIMETSWAVISEEESETK